MQGSQQPTVPPRSNPTSTLDCFTGAIILREGAGAVCSTYRRGSASFTAMPTPTSIVTPTSVSVSLPLMVRPSGVQHPRPRRRARARPLPWALFAAFAVGATLVTFLGTFARDAPFGVAAFACALAGVVTVEAALERRRRSKLRAVPRRQ